MEKILMWLFKYWWVRFLLCYGLAIYFQLLRRGIIKCHGYPYLNPPYTRIILLFLVSLGTIAFVIILGFAKIFEDPRYKRREF